MRPLLLSIPLLLLASNMMGQILLSPTEDSIPMRDGKKLAADVYVPVGSGPFPTILIQTPYNRKLYRLLGLPFFGKDIDSISYTFVITDWRCFYGSSSACGGSATNGEDGYDVVEWITNQSWSDGKVGSWGPSALGVVQYQTAREKPAGLICAAPLVAAPQTKYLEYFPGGAARTEYIQQLSGLGFSFASLLYSATVYNNIWAVTEAGSYYPSEIDIPMFLIGGWYDHNTDVMLEMFDGLQTVSDTSIRDEHKMLIGPWTHGGVGSDSPGELYYPAAMGWSDSLALQFFDHYLLGLNNGWENNPPVQYFQMGEDEWQAAAHWPPDNLLTDTIYLHQGGNIAPDKPANNSSTNAYYYDPKDPSPTHGGATLRIDLLQGPYDQSQVVEGRNDIAVFSTDTFITPYALKGKAKAVFSVSSDQPDTDFVIRLTDVYPDGRSMLLTENIQRMRFRDGYTANDTSLIAPGQVYTIEIELPHIANTFMPGHRLRVDITSSNYPRFDNNLNNGDTLYVAGDTLIANNTVYHNATHPSYLVLPVAEKLSSGTSIAENGKEISLKIFPNPSSGVVHIQSAEAREKHIEVFNLEGQKIKQTYLPAGYSDTFSMESLPSGMYFLRLTSANTVIVEKIMLNKN